MRTLVIGTSGQLASELRRVRPPAQLRLLPPEKVDLADEPAVSGLLERTRPELVINAGAYTAVDRAETERDQAFAVNARGPATLALWCEQQGAALIHVSTDYVFGGGQATPYQVDDVTSPVNVYGESKLGGELAVRAALRRHVILRTSWVFSAHGQNFVKTMLRLAKERDELRVVADQVGRPTPADSLAHAVWAVARQVVQPAEIAWGTYHFAGAGVVSWHGLAQAVVAEQERYTGKAPPVTPIATSDFPTPAKRPASSVLDTTSFTRAFGLEPTPWRDGVGRVVRELMGEPAG